MSDSPLFHRLPGSRRAAPGLEHRVWRRLPALLLWGTLLPLLLAGLNHWLAPAAAPDAPLDGAVLLRDFVLIGWVVLHWTLVLTVAIGCFIVRVMKGPGYVADGYALPQAGQDTGMDGARGRYGAGAARRPR